MDSKLKEILRDEKKKNERERHKDKTKERERERERETEKDKTKERNKIHVKDDIEKFMFVYEDKDGKLFTNLKSISVNEGDTVKIFPVYVKYWNDNLNEEEITYKDKRYIPSEENKDSSWLNIINDPKMIKVDFDKEDAVVYNGKFFHCEKDLIEYIQIYGGEYLPISK